MNLNFKKATTNRIFQHVADEIQTAILDGRLQSGDLLPSEMKLKEMFATSRGTIREALRVLEQKGLISIKVGVTGGAVVKAPDAGQVTECLQLLVKSEQVSLKHLLEFRQEVEAAVAELAAQRATRQDIERLTELLRGARQLLSRAEAHGNRLLEIDTKIHITIAQIADNPVFLAVLRMVHKNILNSFDWLALKNSYSLHRNFKDMEMIVSAIEKGDTRQARRLAQEHIRNCHQYAAPKDLQPDTNGNRRDFTGLK